MKQSTVIRRVGIQVMESFILKKILNNNVVIASDIKNKEVVLIGKGLGFGKKSGDKIESDSINKLFRLEDHNEQEQYKKLVSQSDIDEEMIGIMSDIIFYIKERMNLPLNEHIHIALTDHISFAIKRIQQGLEVSNPFLIETKTLYPIEYSVASEVVTIIKEKTSIILPEGEIGFIALHIHSAIVNKPMTEVSNHSQLISTIINLIEEYFKIQIKKDSMDYLRLIRHLRYTIERVKSGEMVEEPKKLALVLKDEYPLCYNFSWKIIKVMQQAIQLPVYDAEAVYLTMHIQRLVNKN